MPHEIYEIVARGARYWFLFLMAVIAWRSYRWLHKDRRQRKKRLKLLPDAGFVGELVMQNSLDDLEEGAAFAVPQEGVLGAQRGCDLYLPVADVAKRHLWFRYESGLGLRLRLFPGCRALADGQEVGRRDDIHLAHGSRIRVGEAELRLRMFAGFEAVARAVVPGMDGDAPEDAPGDQPEGAAVGVNPVLAQQAALWQAQQNAMRQQYWMMAQQAAAQQMAVQAMLQSAATGQAVQAVRYAQPWTGDAEAPEPEETDLGADREEEPGGYRVLTEGDGDFDGAFDDDAFDDDSLDDDAFGDSRAETPKRLFNPFAPAAEEPMPSGETRFAAEQAIYPPAMDGAEDSWPYAEYPQSSAVFENHGYTYPEYVESEDEDLTDAAAAPPKSLYVEHDEAANAKRLLWDKYLGGGRKP